jgi:hypothetical protein
MVQWKPTDWLRVSVDGLFSEEKNTNHVRGYLAQGVFNRGLFGAPDSVTVENDTAVQFDGSVLNYRGVINDNIIRHHTHGGGFNFVVGDGSPITANLDLSYFSYFEAARDRFTPVVFFKSDGTNTIAARQQFA